MGQSPALGGQTCCIHILTTISLRTINSFGVCTKDCLISSSQFLCTVVADISARVLTTTSPDDQPILSSRHYQHTDRDSGTQLVCDKCPAGTYVSVHCSPTAVRECSPCPQGTFTRRENGVEQCHRCRAPCPAGFLEKSACMATQDRVCTCPPNSFLSGDNGAECKPHSLCPPGTRVKKRGSEMEDVLCKPCTRGTFSDVESSALKCRNHTDCQAQGLVLLTAGTRETDNVCGPSSTASVYTTPKLAVPTEEPWYSSTSPAPLTGHAQKGESGEAHRAEGLLLSHPGTPTPNSDPPRTPLRQAPKQPMEHDGGGISSYYRPSRRGSPRPSTHNHFDINEHLPWMIVLLLLLVLVVIVVCSVKRSSRVLKKGPMQDPSSIMEKAIQKKPSAPPTQVREKWIYYSNGQGVDILKLVAAHVGTQWIDIYQSLANATEREVAAFSNGYSSDHERAYAALQHWTIRDSDANLAKLINALHRQRRIDVVEKIRCVMEDNPQVSYTHVLKSLRSSSESSPKSSPSPKNFCGMEQSPVDRTKGFFPDESEPLLRCDSTSSKDSALSRNGSFITKEKKDTVLRQVRLDPCDLQPIFDDMLHILNPEELHVIEEIPAAEDKLDQLFEIAGVKSQEASQTLLDSVYSHLPDLL
uniref:Tumor necrosis factor receptor superfamily, member 21 n=1 Tax=Acanthochromis polyacanthus TaxID=80966 RepID=A0A3Q1GHC7_9TELE